MKTKMQMAAVCPLCQAQIPLGGLDSGVDEAVLARHFMQHPLVEWVRCMQDLRQEASDSAAAHRLRGIPYWAMPHA